jgi:hypothetical protein
MRSQRSWSPRVRYRREERCMSLRSYRVRLQILHALGKEELRMKELGVTEEEEVGIEFSFFLFCFLALGKNTTVSEDFFFLSFTLFQ